MLEVKVVLKILANVHKKDGIVSQISSQFRVRLVRDDLVESSGRSIRDFFAGEVGVDAPTYRVWASSEVSRRES